MGFWLLVLFIRCSVTLTTKAFLRSTARLLVAIELRCSEFGRLEVCVTFLEVMVMDDIEELNDSGALPRLHVGSFNAGWSG